MSDNITMKDIAAHFEVSLNTVHKAINGKPGISEATRQKLLSYAEEHGYKRNLLAANLKKSELSIAVCCPGNTKNSRFFYDFIWEGIRKYFQDNQELMNVRLNEYPYALGMQEEALINIIEAAKKGELDGLILNPPKSSSGEELLKQLSELDFPVVFVTDNNPDRKCLGTVCADYYTAGRMMAEQFLNIKPYGGDLLLLSGDPKKASHFEICRGFSDYNTEHASKLSVRYLYGYHDYGKLRSDFKAAVGEHMPDMIGAVFATGSSLIRELYSDLHIPDEAIIIGNDLFSETIQGMQEGIFTNLVYKDPKRQGYLSAKMLCDYLTGNILPEDNHISVEATMIFRSNLFYYICL